MSDFTVEDTVSAFKQCGADIGENGLRAKVATELINMDSKPEAVATYAKMDGPKDAKCVIDTLNGRHEEPSAYERMKGFLKEAYDSVKDGVQSINTADIKRAAGMAITDATNTVTGGGVDAAQSAVTKSGMALKNPTLGG